MWFSYAIEFEKHWFRLWYLVHTCPWSFFLNNRDKETRLAVTAVSETGFVYPRIHLYTFCLYRKSATKDRLPVGDIRTWGTSKSCSAGWKWVEQEREESKFLDFKNHSLSRCYFPAFSTLVCHETSVCCLFSFCILPHVKKSPSKTFLHELETLSCLGLNVPVFEQFLAVACLYGVVMVNPESSEDGGSAKLLGKELLTGQDSEELEISNVGHWDH